MAQLWTGNNDEFPKKKEFVFPVKKRKNSQTHPGRKYNYRCCFDKTEIANLKIKNPYVWVRINYGSRFLNGVSLFRFISEKKQNRDRTRTFRHRIEKEYGNQRISITFSFQNIQKFSIRFTRKKVRIF